MKDLSFFNIFFIFSQIQNSSFIQVENQTQFNIEISTLKLLLFKPIL